MKAYRRRTREVKVGSIGIGGDNPIRMQSMTTSSTRDVEATVNQIVRLEEAGCEIVRVTVQGIKEAESCQAIREALLQRGCRIPLVADIHFYPPAALKVVEFVDKVRINPGNFADKRALFIKKEYDDTSYQEEVMKIEEVFTPLVLKCRSFGKALRIGVNHGSLSDRIMNRYGDTPHGMVESAFEFVRICRKHEFHDLIFSMKASNPLVMIRAYRLLAEEMDRLGWDYPIHLGVTESGEGEDGRVKSALGIGSLLADGIGDTIRVSLTEDPWAEIDPCRRLSRLIAEPRKEGGSFQKSYGVLPRNVVFTEDSFLHPKGSVIVKVTGEELESPGFLETISAASGKKELFTPDAVWLEEISVCNERVDAVMQRLSEIGVPVLSSKSTHPKSMKIAVVKKPEESAVSAALAVNPHFLLFAPERNSLVQEGRELVDLLRRLKVEVPTIAVFTGDDSWEDAVIHSSASCGSLLMDGLIEGICLDVGDSSYSAGHNLSFALMQAAGKRTVKTEFISCPGCGRTLFDLQTVSKRIRDKTSHLPGVKIAIMGCIVNGPGEMADADFGYVGSKAGKIDLYIGYRCVEKNIDFEQADEKLIELIKSQGKWVEKAIC